MGPDALARIGVLLHQESDDLWPSLQHSVVKRPMLVVFCQIQMHELTEETHPLLDLKLDSQQQLTLVVELENRFRVAFGDGDEAGIERVRDVVDLLERRLSRP